jgi:hypothetical protein
MFGPPLPITQHTNHLARYVEQESIAVNPDSHPNMRSIQCLCGFDAYPCRIAVAIHVGGNYHAP